MSKDSEAKNLQAIYKAIDWHNNSCPFDLAKILMNPFEIERLDWDNIRGIPLEGDPEMQTGRFRLVCSNDLEKEEQETVEAISEERELVNA